MSRGHCHDWFRKWKREHNFCGLRKQDAVMMDRYIDLTEKIAGNGAGMEEDFIHDHFTAGAARPLLRCKNDAASVKALNYVIACLKRGEDVTGGDLEATINGYLGKPEKAQSTQMRQETPAVLMEKEPVVIQTLAQQQAGKESPFKTGAEVLAHDRDPLGIDVPAPATVPNIDTSKVVAATMNELAEDLLDLMPKGTQLIVSDQMRDHPSWKVKDVFYYGIEALAEKKAGRKI